MTELTLPSFAKINLTLRVLGRQPNGFHNIDTILQSIELHDLLSFHFTKGAHFEVVLDTGSSGLPADQTNLVYQACAAFNKVHPIPARVEVKIEKHIPMGSGLGGGSSNAAVTLVALSRYLNWPINRTRLLELAAALGSDVPFFLYGGTSHSTGRGEQIEPVVEASNLRVLVIYPGFSCSTAEIYRKFDEAALLTENTNFIKILNDLKPESYRAIVSQIGNDLEKIVFALYPELDSIKKRLLETGAVAAALTGSGSALFGLFSSTSDLEKAAQQFPDRYQTQFLNRSDYEKRLGF